MDFAGNDDLRGLSYNFEKFTPREIEQYLSLYIVQGLNLAPQINMKAKNQFQGQVQGNDIIGSIIFDKNFERRRKQFRRYFALQHLYLLIPSQKARPNRKVDHFLYHLNIVFV